MVNQSTSLIKHSNQIYQGDVLAVLKTLPDEFIQCVVTSPPYWGLRDYGVNGQMGLEKTPDEFIGKMVEAFREVRRVLKKDGTLWLNLGDSYAGSWGNYGGKNRGRGRQREITAGSQAHQKAYDGLDEWRPPASWTKDTGLKSKDLVGIPWLVAFALRSDGWYLRSDIIWSKPNPMPESVMDRPTKAHEYIFLLSKSARYFYNHEAIKEPAIYGVPNSPESIKSPYGQGFSRSNGFKELPVGQSNIRQARDKQRGHSRRHAGFNDRWDQMEKKEQCSGMRNKRSVWEISTRPFPEAHFATFPEDIPTICIKAGSRENDIVLDPFMGSGTTAIISKRLKRSYLGIELNPSYVAMAERRIAGEGAPLLVE